MEGLSCSLGYQEHCIQNQRVRTCPQVSDSLCSLETEQATSGKQGQVAVHVPAYTDSGCLPGQVFTPIPAL